MAYAQDVPQPDDFLGYPLGSQFTRHFEVVNYVKAVEKASPKVQVTPYGKTYEGRELVLAIVSSPENLANLEEIRLNNLRAAGMADGNIKGQRIPIVWLSYNIHGNEPSPSEAAMKTLYELTTNDTANWLNEVVVIIDPCINPDGRDRYVNWYRQAANSLPNVLPESWEHQEPWPGGRVNHYLFDLNRDWCWQTQEESRQRAIQYHKWMPHVHVDYHEQGVNDPYYFGPAAEPFHEVITDWQRNFQVYTGKNHAKYFDKRGWLYFSREIFDLFYPSYGDTWPTYQGAIGFTYEQAGHGTAGRGIRIQNGDTLTLSDRISHHFITGLSTVESAVKLKDSLLENFDQYFEDAKKGANSPYKSFVISHKNPPHKLASFLELLDRNAIQYEEASATKGEYKGYDFQAHETTSFRLNESDVVISMNQPQANLIRVLLEPEAKLVDSLTYDLTAWSLPFAYDLQAWAVDQEIKTKAFQGVPLYARSAKEGDTPYGYACKWEDMGAATFLSKALVAGFKARYTTVETSIRNITLEKGSLVFLKADNKGKNLLELNKLAGDYTELYPIESGFSDMGKDLGSDTYKLIHAPKIAIAGGSGVNPGAFGESWYYFERVLEYPVSVIPAENLNRAPLASYDIVVLPSGRYQRYRKTLKNFVQQGGRVIALEGAMSTFAGHGENDPFKTSLSQALEEAIEKEAEEEVALQPYEGRERSSISNYTAGSIYALTLDPTHPLSYGLGKQIHIIKRNGQAYPFLSNGYQVGILESGKPVSGFSGSRLQKRLKDSMVWGAERQGGGQIIYFADSPIFRGFWYTGKLAMANSIFFW